MKILLFIYHFQQILKLRLYNLTVLPSPLQVRVNLLNCDGHADLMKFWIKVTQHTNIGLQFSLQTVTERFCVVLRSGRLKDPKVFASIDFPPILSMRQWLKTCWMW